MAVIARLAEFKSLDCAAGGRVAQTLHQFRGTVRARGAIAWVDRRACAGSIDGAHIIRTHDVAPTVQALRVA